MPYKLFPAWLSFLGPVVAVAVGANLALAQAQQDPSSHSQHHPGGAPATSPPPTSGAPPAADTSTPPSASPSTVAAPTGAPGASAAPGMMEQMMGMMAPNLLPKELYPTMMTLPSLTEDQRAEIRRRAQERMTRGSSMIADAHNRLFWAGGANDAAAMSEASALLREGVAIFDSGLAAQRAIAEGRPPQEVALTWFKREMNLAAAASPQLPRGAPVLSLFHTTAMAAVGAFAILAVIVYLRRSRRVAALLQQLANQGAGAIRAGPPPARLDATLSPQSSPVRPALAPSTSIRSETPSALGKESHEDPPAPLLVKSGRVAPWQGALRVATIFDETPNIKTFRLVDPGGTAIPFAFAPGQFLWLKATVGGVALKRSYTIASSPTRRDYVELTVKREDQGALSRYLHSTVTVGDQFDIEAPFGYFTFTGTEADSIVLIGGGVGATPLMSVARYLTDRCWSGDIFYLYCCRTSVDFVFREELEQLQRRHRNLHVMATMTRAAGTVWIGPEGRITKALIEQTVPDIARRRVHLCGPAPMMDEIRSILSDLGVPRPQLKTEAFGTQKRAAVAVQPTRGIADFLPVNAAAQLQRAPASAPIVLPTITFSRSGKSVLLRPDMTVLEAAEAVGVQIENSCRSGTCGTCKVKLISGTVSMEVEDALEPGEKEQGWILACQAKATVDLAVEA